MNFAPIELDEDLHDFLTQVRTFFDEHVTPEVLEHERLTGDGYHEGLHRALGQRGWIVPGWPVEEGGAGLDPLRAGIVLSELWDSRAPDILRFTTVLVAATLRPWAAPDLLAEVLPGVGRGDVRLCQGLTEPDSGSDVAAARTTATRTEAGWVINGSKMFTSHAHHATYCCLLARTNPDLPKHKGLTMFLVPMNVPGIEVRGVQTVGHERTNLAFFENVQVDDRFRLGPVDGGWSVLNTQLTDEHGRGQHPDVTIKFMVLTQLRQVYEAIVEWARTPGPSGHTPMEDAQVRRRLARVALHLEVIDDTPEEMSRVLGSELLIRDTADLLDLLGPSGVLQEGDCDAPAAGLAELRHRSAQATAIYGGSTDIHRNILAEQHLGLPRHRMPLTPRGAR